MGVFDITFFWSLCGLRWDILAMRLDRTTILLGMITLIMPALRGWRASRTIATFIAILTGTIFLGVSSTGGAPLARPTTAVGQILIN